MSDWNDIIERSQKKGRKLTHWESEHPTYPEQDDNHGGKRCKNFFWCKNKIVYGRKFYCSEKCAYEYRKRK